MPSVCFPVAGLNPTLPFLPAGDSLDTLLLSCFLSLLFLSIIFLSLFLNLFHSLKFGFCFLFLVVSLFFSLPKKNTKMGEDSHQPPKSVTRPAPLPPPHTHTQSPGSHQRATLVVPGAIFRGVTDKTACLIHVKPQVDSQTGTS